MCGSPRPMWSALIDTGRPGKTIAVRGDIDALPVHEEANVPFKSED